MGKGDSKKVIELPLGGYGATHSLGGLMPSAPQHVKCAKRGGQRRPRKTGLEFTTCASRIVIFGR
jgi:hypothetical protein